LNFFYRNRIGAVDYVIEIHPPIVVENLLPHRAVFEIMHADNEGNTNRVSGRKRMLWVHELAHGDVVPIHNVGLESELKLLINLGFCRSSGDGALIHIPSDSESRTTTNEDMGIMDVMAAVGLGGVRKT
jgi:translation initiation factor IF-1